MPIPGKIFIDGEVVTHLDLNQAQSGLTFAEGEIPGSALVDGGIARQKLADGIINNDKVLLNSLSPDRLETAPEDIANNRGGVILVSDSAGDYQAVHPTGDVDVSAAGNISLKDSAVTTAKLATNAVTKDKIGIGEVSSYHMRTLVYDTSLTFGSYAVSIPNLGAFNAVEHVGLFITVLVGLKNTVAATLSVNGGSAYPLRTPSGDAVGANQISGGQVLSLVFTGSSWAVMSPLTTIVRTELYRGSTSVPNTSPVSVTPANLASAKVRIRLWGKGGLGLLRGTGFPSGASTQTFSNGTPATSGYTESTWNNLLGSDAVRTAGGGSGGYAEWYGTLATAGLTNGDTLQINFSNTDATVAKVLGGGGTTLLLRVTAGSDADGTISGLNSLIAGAAGAGAPASGGIGTLPALTGAYAFRNGSPGKRLFVDFSNNTEGRKNPSGGALVNGQAAGGGYYWPDGLYTPTYSTPGTGYCIIELEDV